MSATSIQFFGSPRANPNKTAGIFCGQNCEEGSNQCNQLNGDWEKSSNKQPKTDTGSALKSRSGIKSTPELSLDWSSTTSRVYKEEADVLLFQGGDTSQ